MRLKPIKVSVFISGRSKEVICNGKRGIQLFPYLLEILLLLFADDEFLLSDSVNGLQTQLNVLKTYSDKWNLKGKFG